MEREKLSVVEQGIKHQKRMEQANLLSFFMDKCIKGPFFA
jgi:hypothetical protein